MKRFVRKVQKRFQRAKLQARMEHARDRRAHSDHRGMAVDSQTMAGPPIFVVGVQRSGTSLLRRVLDSHPNIACPPESKFILPLEALLNHPQALEGLDSMGFPRPVVTDRLREFVAGFFEEYAWVKGKSRWADKTPNYVDCLPFLEELFAGSAQYVVIVRHPFDVCLSFENAWKKSGRPMRVLRPYVDQAEDFREGGCRFWNEQSLKIASFIPHVAGRIVSVSYEWLTSYPETALRGILEFLNEPWDPVVLDYNRVRHDSGFEDRKIQRMPQIVSNSGKFLDWPETERQRLGVITRKAMKAFGYDPHRAVRGRATAGLEKTFLVHPLE
jgi:hypothetical protein